LLSVCYVLFIIVFIFVFFYFDILLYDFFKLLFISLVSSNFP
jgi:hypothetical protein